MFRQKRRPCACRSMCPRLAFRAGERRRELPAAHSRAATPGRRRRARALFLEELAKDSLELSQASLELALRPLPGNQPPDNRACQASWRLAYLLRREWGIQELHQVWDNRALHPE